MPINKPSRGFTLVEFATVFAVIALLTAVFLPRFIRSKDTERELEVKDNIHRIQVALERYAVDSGGVYPLILYGGDETDTFARLGAPVNPATGFTYCYPPDDPGYAAFPGDVDVLISFGYLSEYPENPFMSGPEMRGFGRIQTNPAENGFGPLEFHFDTSRMARVNIWAQPFDRSLVYVHRLVGGERGDLMWDVSEGQRHAPWPIVVVPEPAPDPTATGYVNPVYPGCGDNVTAYGKSHQFYLTPGNFYYYAVFEGLAGYSPFLSTNSSGANPNAPISGNPVGYRLCGYGGPTNTGEDVYNLWGDFPDRSFFTSNSQYQGPLTLKSTYVGPDGRPDGVIFVVSSGIDAKE